jgi:hypothetical protein
VPDIFNISTVTTDKGSHKVLKMGDYQGNFDINGRAMSLEPVNKNYNTSRYFILLYQHVRVFLLVNMNSET